MSRTTMSDLESLIRRLNKACGYPETGWQTVNDRNRPYVDAYTLNASYGGYALCQYVNTDGAERSITSLQRAKDCAVSIRAYAAGKGYAI